MAKMREREKLRKEAVMYTGTSALVESGWGWGEGGQVHCAASSLAKETVAGHILRPGAFGL